MYLNTSIHFIPLIHISDLVNFISLMTTETDVLEFALDASHVLRIPKHFGRYEYVKTIGAGASSIVLLVRHVVTSSLFACKVVSRQQLIDENNFVRFEQEVRLLGSLSHPNVVRVEEIVFEPELIYLILEYCCQGDLFSHIVAEGMFAEHRARLLFRQIAEALSYIHSKDIAHRDLKPDNILIDREFNAKLADFGLCHVTNSKQLLQTPCGSPLYAPPEILSGQGYDGKAADIWSLGIVLYAMVTGMLPWSSENQIELFRQIKECPIEIPPHLSPLLQDLLSRMLDKDPAKRATIGEVLNSPWFPRSQPGWKGIGRASSYSVYNMPGIQPPTSPLVLVPAKRIVIRPRPAGVAASMASVPPLASLQPISAGVKRGRAAVDLH
jgi:serine/threonine protein kinase